MRAGQVSLCVRRITGDDTMTTEPTDTPRIARVLGDASFIVAMFAPLLTFLAASCIGIGPEAYRHLTLDAVFYGIHAVAVGLGVISNLRSVNGCACAGIILGVSWPAAVWLFS